MALPAIARAPNIVRQAQTCTLLHDMRGLVRGQAQRWGVAKRNTIPGRESERAHPAVRGFRGPPDAGAHSRYVVTSERRLDPLAMGQGQARIPQSVARLAPDHVWVADWYPRVLHLLLRLAGGTLCLYGRLRLSLLGLHAGGLAIFTAIPELHRLRFGTLVALIAVIGVAAGRLGLHGATEAKDGA
jgi:hypothetical protein